MTTVSNSSWSSFSAERFASGGSVQKIFTTPTRILRSATAPNASPVNRRPSSSRRSEACPEVCPGVRITRKPETRSPSRSTLPTGGVDNCSHRSRERTMRFGRSSSLRLPETISASCSVAPSLASGDHSSRPDRPPVWSVWWCVRKIRLRSRGSAPRAAEASRIRPTLLPRPVSTSVHPSSFSSSKTENRVRKTDRVCPVHPRRDPFRRSCLRQRSPPCRSSRGKGTTVPSGIPLSRVSDKTLVGKRFGQRKDRLVGRRGSMATVVGVPREIKDGEMRVSMQPDGVAELVHHGHEVVVEEGAGVGAGFDDEEYAEAGATIVGATDEVFERAGLIVKVKEPIAEEYDRFREGHELFTYLHLASDKGLTEFLMERKVNSIAYETVELPDGSLPLLAPMSEVAGRMAVQAAAHHLESPQGGAGLLLGGVPGTPA